MRKKITFLYIGLLILLAFNSAVSARKAVDSLYYYMKIDTSGVNVGFLRIDSFQSNKLVIDQAGGKYAFWRFTEFQNQNNISEPNHYWIINYKTQDTLKFKAPVPPRLDTVAYIDENGNLFRWEQLFLDVNSDVDTLVASYTEPHMVLTHSFFLTLKNSGEVMLLDKRSAAYPKIRFQIQRATVKPDTSKFYRLKIDTLDTPVEAPLGYLAIDSVVNTDSLTLDSVKNFYSAWKFHVDTILNDTTYYKIYNRETGKLLAFDVPENDTVAVISDTGRLNTWLMPFFLADEGREKFTVRDTTTRREYYLGLKDSIPMLVSDTSKVKIFTFALEDEFLPVYVPPAVERFDSTQVYKVKKLSGNGKGKYMTLFLNSIVYADSVYAHIPDGQFVVNKLNTSSLINRNVASVVTDTFKYVITAGDTVPDVFVYKNDTIEARPIDYGSPDMISDSLLGYKYFPIESLRKDSCYYLKYVSADSLNGRILGADQEIRLLALGDTARYFIEHEGVDYGTEAPANIAALRRNIYKLRSQKDTMLYFTPHIPSQMGSDKGFFLFKEGEIQEGYSLVENRYGLNKFIIDSVSKRLDRTSVDDSISSLFRFVKTEIPVYPDDEFQYLRYLPGGRGLYEVHSTINSEEKMLTKNFSNYAIFSKEGESVLRAGSYLPADFYLWLDTARGPRSNRFRTSVYIIKNATDTVGFNVQGYFLHVKDSSNMLSSSNFYVEVDGKKYSRANFVHAKRTASNKLQLLLDEPYLIGEGTSNEKAINEYRFYLQKTDADETKYHIVTEKDYGGHSDSTGYLSYSYMEDKYYFGPRAGAKLTVRLVKIGGSVANEVVRPPSIFEKIDNKEITVNGETGQVRIQNAVGLRVQVYNIVGQVIADKIVSSDDEVITSPHGIVIVRAGKSVTKKVVVK